MPLNSGIWGEDPSSDIVRYLRSGLAHGFSHLGSLNLQLDGAQVLSPSLAERIAANTNATQRAATTADQLALLLPELLEPLTLGDSTLVLQVDSFNGLIDDGEHAPAPLIYYRYVLETRFWSKVVLVDYSKHISPITEYLVERYPRIQLCKGSLIDKWRTVAHARQAVLGVAALSRELIKLVDHQKRVWLLEHSLPTKDWVQQNSTTQLMPIAVTDYLTGTQWRGRRDQIAQVMKTPVSAVVDKGRWLFTETERCRSFEFCQQCRDTSATGKLWRKMIAARFEVESVNWECPHGWRWGGKPTWRLALLRRLKLGSAFKKTAAVLGAKDCKDCQRRGEQMDGLRK